MLLPKMLKAHTFPQHSHQMISHFSLFTLHAVLNTVLAVVGNKEQACFHLSP